MRIQSISQHIKPLNSFTQSLHITHPRFIINHFLTLYSGSFFSAGYRAKEEDHFRSSDIPLLIPVSYCFPYLTLDSLVSYTITEVLPTSPSPIRAHVPPFNNFKSDEKQNKLWQERTPFERKKLCPKVGENSGSHLPFASPRPWLGYIHKTARGRRKKMKRREQ